MPCLSSWPFNILDLSLPFPSLSPETSEQSEDNDKDYHHGEKECQRPTLFYLSQSVVPPDTQIRRMAG